MFKKSAEQKTVTHIWSLDPAIDQEATAYNPVKYVETRDEQYMPRKNGVEPVRFKLATLSGTAKEAAKAIVRAEMSKEVGAQDHSRIYFELARRCLVGVEGAQYDDGTPLQLQTTVDRTEKVRILDEQSLAVVYSLQDGHCFYELGARAFREVFGDPT